MGKIAITTNLSLDGVVQDPDGAEETKNPQLDGAGTVNPTRVVGVFDAVYDSAQVFKPDG